MSAIAVLSGCAGTIPNAAPTSPASSGAELEEPNQDAMCTELRAVYLAALDQTSTGRDHPDNYRLIDATPSDLVERLPDGALDGVEFDCTFAVHSGAVDSTQIIAIKLNETQDHVDRIAEKVQSSGWEAWGSTPGAYRALAPSTDGVLVTFVDKESAAILGAPEAVMLVSSGDWTQWGAF